MAASGRGSTGEGFSLETEVLGALPVLDHYWGRLGLSAWMSRAVGDGDGRSRLSPAKALRVAITAHSGDSGHPFRLIPDTRSGRNRTGVGDAVAHFATSKNLRGRSGGWAGRRGVREPLRRVDPGLLQLPGGRGSGGRGRMGQGPFGLASPSSELLGARSTGGPRLRVLAAGLGCAVPPTPVVASTRASCATDGTKMTSTARITRSITRRRRSWRDHAGGGTGPSRRRGARTGGSCPRSPRPRWDPPWLGASPRPAAG